MYRPLAILRNEVGETRADDAMSSSPSKGTDWFADTTCWLAAKGGDKIITESHLLGDKHYPSGGDAAVMKGVDVLMAEVANLSLKGYIVPDRGSMIWRRPIEICFLLAALGACKTGENDISEGLKDPDWHERARAVRALGGSRDHVAAVRALEPVFQNDPDHHVRMDVTFALGQLGGPDATALLVEKAASTDESVVRVAALDAIGTSRDPSATPGLINLFRLNRGQDDVKAQIGASDALLKIGAPGVPRLLQALNDSSAKVRWAVVEVLGEMGSPELADRIVGLQDDPDFGVRRAVAGALAKLKATKQ
jgi:hypothetical protein